MKLYASVIKSLKEVIRDWKVLALVLLFSPIFVLLMKLFYGEGSTTYNIGIINLDDGSQSIELLQNLEAQHDDTNEKLFQLVYLDSQLNLEEKVKDKSVDIGIVIPEAYSQVLSEYSSGKRHDPAVVNVYGSFGNAKYTVAAVLACDIIDKHGIEVSKIELPISIKETFLEKKQSINGFDNSVPGLISLSVLMLLFTTTASIVKENEKNTLIRLKLSRLGAINYLIGVSIVQAVIASLGIVLTYWISLLLGYKPAGTFLPVLVVGILSSFSMVAMSLIIASFLNTVFDVLTIGCFPFFVVMFFSGCMFPLPEMNMVTIAGKSFSITDILALTHTTNAFYKILNYGLGFSDISFDLFMIALLTFVYLILGITLYQKRKLSKV